MTTQEYLFGAIWIVVFLPVILLGYLYNNICLAFSIGEKMNEDTNIFK